MQGNARAIDTEVEQADVDGLVRDLEAMRAVLGRDRTALRPQLEAMIFRAERMRDRAAGSRFEKSLTSAYDMLLKLQQGHTGECPRAAEPPTPDRDSISRASAGLLQRWPFRRIAAA